MPLPDQLAGPFRSTPFAIDLTARPDPTRFAGRAFCIFDWSINLQRVRGRMTGPLPKFFAYVSVGEIAPDAPYLNAARESGVRFMGINPNWGSYYIYPDQVWRDFVIGSLAMPIVEKGFDGFFLDTVEAFNDLAANHPAEKQNLRGGTAALIISLKTTYPNLKTITNGGFKIFQQVREYTDGFLVESLFQTYSGKKWLAQDSGETRDMLRQLEKVKPFQPVYVIDYCDPQKPKLAARTAQRISRLGFHPLIVARSLDGTVLAPR